jgi:Mn-dependent DtxR family transcriptional regulator
VKNKLTELWNKKYLHGDKKSGFRLTQAGYAEAVRIIQSLT